MQRTGSRWLALLLALLFAMVTLSSHVAMESHQDDCRVAAEWMADEAHSSNAPSAEHDHDAASCIVCFTAMGQSLLPMVGPERQVTSLAMAMFPQIPLTPRRPPKVF